CRVLDDVGRNFSSDDIEVLIKARIVHLVGRVPSYYLNLVNWGSSGEGCRGRPSVRFSVLLGRRGLSRRRRWGGSLPPSGDTAPAPPRSLPCTAGWAPAPAFGRCALAILCEVDASRGERTAAFAF